MKFVSHLQLVGGFSGCSGPPTKLTTTIFYMSLIWTDQRSKADHANYYTTDAVHNYVVSRRNCNDFQLNAQ
jgi:hypothetical protein